mmetsp:Transcript_54441/g.133459  ORF Transcript_54441/g.133459 Transcript_54441/m.133459 type:complete len:293 (+) Transcript_54441:921-1799(+)
MVLYSRLMARVARFLGHASVSSGYQSSDPDTAFDTIADYEQHAADFERTIEAVHWNDKLGVYTDASAATGAPTDDDAHVGYVSLFPLMLGVHDVRAACRTVGDGHDGGSDGDGGTDVGGSGNGAGDGSGGGSNSGSSSGGGGGTALRTLTRVARMLDVLEYGSALRSAHGVLSLARTDAYYGKDENYWRGPIWINMNYLLLGALRRIADDAAAAAAASTVANERCAALAERAARLHDELRGDVLRTVFGQYEKRGSFWEQYHPDTGAGQRSQPFTGWTALAVLVRAGVYVRW